MVIDTRVITDGSLDQAVHFVKQSDRLEISVELGQTFELQPFQVQLPFFYTNAARAITFPLMTEVRRHRLIEAVLKRCQCLAMRVDPGLPIFHKNAILNLCLQARVHMLTCSHSKEMEMRIPFIEM